MPNASDTFESLPIDADRLCEGISKIGYRPSAALMDIGDNSVTAGARNVRITLDLRPDASLGTKGGVLAFRIWDDGVGMTDEQVKKALQLGSQGEYPAHSLSKFGLGLKSAGFSLGDRISVLSKHDGLLSHLWTLDRDVIRERGVYGAFSEDPPAELAELLADVPSGTVIEITKVLPRQDSANRIRRELAERLGVTYYEFLAREVDPLKITLHYGNKTETIDAVDFLFLADAKSAFDPDDYDCKSPVRALTRELDNPLDPSGPKLKLEIAFFPQASMASFAAFSEAERSRIKEYKIGRGNHGFFFYRNGRLIVWGDHLAGVTRNDITFRARLSFTDAHDELLHVDVSKQHLMVPEEVEETLKTLARIPLSQASQASQLCTKLTREGVGVEGEEFNRRRSSKKRIPMRIPAQPRPPRYAESAGKRLKRPARLSTPNWTRAHLMPARAASPPRSLSSRRSPPSNASATPAASPARISPFRATTPTSTPMFASTRTIPSTSWCSTRFRQRIS